MKRGDKNYSLWWDFSAVGRPGWISVFVFAIGVIIYVIVGPQQSPAPNWSDSVSGAEQRQQPQQTAVETILNEALGTGIVIGFADLAEAQVRRTFLELKGPALKSYLDLITAPSFRLFICLLPEDSSSIQYELKRRLTALPDLLDGPLVRNLPPPKIDLSEVSPVVANPSTSDVIDRQLHSVCSWPIWLIVVQTSVAVVAIFLAVYFLRGGLVGRSAFVILAFLVAAIGSGYVFLLTDRIISRDRMSEEVRVALELDESKIIEDVREALQDFPITNGAQAVGTPRERFQ